MWRTERFREGFLQLLTNSSACAEARRLAHKPLPLGLGGTQSAFIYHGRLLTEVTASRLFIGSV